MTAKRIPTAGHSAALGAAGAKQSSATLYGIPNCDQVKKARVWLEANHIEYVFYDFKKQGLSAALASMWLDETAADRVVNRKGTTWRALDDAQKHMVDKASGAAALICEQPSLVKRPVLEYQGTRLFGFDADHYQRLIS